MCIRGKQTGPIYPTRLCITISSLSSTSSSTGQNLVASMTSTRGRTSKAASIIASDLSMTKLRQTASWIRDILDPMVSRDGPQSLDPNDVLNLHSILLDLQTEPISSHILRSSRIFLAVRDISGKATRWPAKLVDEADELVEAWTEEMGPLKNIRTSLYEKGGRLHGVCEPHHTEREVQKTTSESRHVLIGHIRISYGISYRRTRSWPMIVARTFTEDLVSSSVLGGSTGCSRSETASSTVCVLRVE
jgi:hypothetical protein